MNDARGVQIALATEGELPALKAISEAAGEAARWSEQQWKDIFRTEIPRRLAWVAWAAMEAAELTASAGSLAPAGFLVAQCGGAEWELENLAVASAFRRSGIGSALLAALLEAARRECAERVLLEVRASNQAAIALYGRAGFERLGLRPKYYREPPEDALILARRV